MRCFFIYILTFVLISTAAAQDIENLAHSFGILPEIRNVKLSPDGSKLLMLQEVNDQTILVTRDLTNPGLPSNGIPIENGHIEAADWANNEQIVATVLSSRYLYLELLNNYAYYDIVRKRKNWDIFKENYVLMDWQGDNSEKLKVKKSIESMLPWDSKHILLRDGERFFEFDLETKEEERVLFGPMRAYGAAHFDKDHNIRYIVTSNTDAFFDSDFSRSGHYRSSMESDWERIHAFDVGYMTIESYKNSLETFVRFVGYSDNPEIIYVIKYDEFGRDALFTYNVKTQKEIEKIASHEKYDLTYADFDENYNLEAYYFNGIRRERVGVSDKYKKIDRLMKKNFPNVVVNIVSHSYDKNVFVMKTDAPDDPGTFYVLDLNNNNMVMIGYNYANLDAEKLSPMKQIVYKASDGLEITGYLTLPKNKDAKNLSTVILPLEDNVLKSYWGFNPEVQYYASLGYAVFQIDYRGALGYGLEHAKSGLFELGDKVISDINDGTKWLIGQGISNPEKICLVGKKYSGYASLQASVKEGALYQCVITTDPIFNFKDYFNSRIDNYLNKKGIDEKDVSPYHQHEKIKASVLIIEEAKVNKRRYYEYNKFIKNLTKNGTFAEKYIVENLNINNQGRILEATGKFLDKHLKN